MARWQYDISTCSVEDVFDLRERLNLAAESQGASKFFCDSKGQCFFGGIPNAEVTALTAFLNARGDQGWELVQFLYHKDEMICFWKRRVQEERPTPIPPHSGGS